MAKIWLVKEAMSEDEVRKEPLLLQLLWPVFLFSVNRRSRRRRRRRTQSPRQLASICRRRSRQSKESEQFSSPRRALLKLEGSWVGAEIWVRQAWLASASTPPIKVFGVIGGEKVSKILFRETRELLRRSRGAIPISWSHKANRRSLCQHRCSN